MIEIKHRETGAVVCSGETVKDAVEDAVKLGLDLSKADLSEADLRRARLIGADLSGAKLSGAKLSGADMIGTNLTGADLSRAKLSGAVSLFGANLEGAILEGAILIDANLSRADLRGADLRGADLSRADLRGAKLNRTKLTGALLEGADLTGADLSRATIEKYEKPPERTPSSSKQETTRTSAVQSRSKQVQGVLVLTLQPLRDSQTLLGQIVDQQRSRGYAIAPTLVASARVGDFNDSAYVYAMIRQVFSGVGGHDLMERTKVLDFQASDGNSGYYYVVFDRV